MILAIVKCGIIAAAWAMAMVIVWRCIGVLRGMHLSAGGCSFWRFLAFGLSYVALAGSALGAALVIGQGDFTLSHIGFLVSSAGLILCDRRRRKPKDESAVPAC